LIAVAETLTSPASVNLMALPTRLSHLREALFVAEAKRERLVHGRRDLEFLVLRERLGGRTHRLNHTLDGVLGYSEVNSILAMSRTVLMSPSRCLPLARMRVRASSDFGRYGS
jgi:hypothetical protein